MSSLRFRFAIAPAIFAASVLAQATDAPAKKGSASGSAGSAPQEEHYRERIPRFIR